MSDPIEDYKGIYCDTWDKSKEDTKKKIIKILTDSGAKEDSVIIKKIKEL